MSNVRIYGAGGHSNVIKDLLLQLNYHIDAVYDDSDIPYKHGKSYPGIHSYKEPFQTKDVQIIVGVGNNSKRKEIAEKIKAKFLSVVHPFSNMGFNVTIEEGTVVFAGAIIQPNTRIGKHTIINTSASIDHDNNVGDYVHISPNATLSGNVTVGEGTHIGSGAVILPNITIGKWVIVGAGTVITSDIPDYCTVVGNPGKIIKREGVPISESGLKCNGKLNVEDFELEIIFLDDKASQKKYKEILQSNFIKNPFYSPEYINRNFDSEGRAACFILKGQNELLGLMPIIIRKIKTSLKNKTDFKDVISPYGYSGPIYFCENKSNICEIFWNKVDSWYKKNKVISEFIRFSLNGNYDGYTGLLNETLENVAGELKSTFDDQWHNFKPKVRNNYRYAQKLNVKFELLAPSEISGQHLKDFYSIYIHTMKRVKAAQKYFYSMDYFDSLIFSNPESFLLAFATVDDKPATTELLIRYNDKLFAFLGGTLKSFMPQRPNDFLRVEIIRWAISHQVKHYILGGGVTKNDSLYKSKKAYFPHSKDLMFCTGRKIIFPKLYQDLINEYWDNGSSETKKLTMNDFFPLYRFIL